MPCPQPTPEAPPRQWAFQNMGLCGEEMTFQKAARQGTRTPRPPPPPGLT